MLVHNVTISTFIKEDIAPAIEVFHKLLPLDFEKEKIDVKQEKTEGFEETIIVLSLKTHKQRHNKTILSSIFGGLASDDKQMLKDQKESRLHDGCFYLRLDKDALLDGEFELVDSGDCFHVRINLAAFPKSNAANVLDQLLETYA